METAHTQRARLPYRLPPDTPADRIEEIRRRIDELGDAAQYGWGHSIDFGPFAKEGLLGEGYLEIATNLDRWGWWPEDLTGRAVADVGCFTGGLSLYLAARNPTVVYAVDELPGHLRQCEYLAEVFDVECIRPVESSVYFLDRHIEEASLDLILLSGVLYHLSDMLVGLYVMGRLLKPGGTLLIESNAVDDFEHSYANFGRFYAGMWWQPTGLCVEDMCRFMGFEDPDVRFYRPQRCLARATRAADEIPFKRGLCRAFESLEDLRPRSMDPGIMAPAATAAAPVAPRGGLLTRVLASLGLRGR
jgi:SAM-dependent methyltransferase